MQRQVEDCRQHAGVCRQGAEGRGLRAGVCRQGARPAVTGLWAAERGTEL